jgi:hypothetical protein
VAFTVNCSKSLCSRPSQIQTLRGSFAFFGSFFGRIAGAFECFATSVRFEGVLATRFIIRIAFGIVRFTFGNFVVFHIIGLVRVNVAFRFSLPRWEFFEALEPLRDQCHSAIVHIGMMDEPLVVED